MNWIGKIWCGYFFNMFKSLKNIVLLLFNGVLMDIIMLNLYYYWNNVDYLIKVYILCI